MEQYFGPFPFWIWNGDMRDEEILRQMKEMKSQGVNEAMICPTAGLETEYPSPEFFKKVRFTCRQAKKLGMSIWLYDDYDWPSGVAGGKILYEHPEYLMRFLRCYHKRVAPDARREVSLKIEDGEILVACLIREGRISDIRVEVERWSRQEVQGTSSYWHCSVPVKYVYRSGTLRLPAGEWEILVCVVTISKILHANAIGCLWCKDVAGYVDTMNTEATDEFVRLTHEQYAKYVGKYFGNVIKGIFTDEPTMLNVHGSPEGWDRTINLPWTHNFTQIFRSNKGYDITSVLPSLVLQQNLSAQTIKLRRDYWEEITGLYFSSYHQKLRNWCDRHKLVYIGHVVSDKVPHGWVENQGDYYRCMEIFSLPAMDYVWSKPMLSPERPYGWKTYEYVNAKVISSIAFHRGIKRACCETFALGGFDAQLSDLKATTSFLAALGVNMTLFSGAMYSLRGNRRRVVPTVHSYQSPFWKHYHLYANYVSRLSRLLSNSRHNADCALLYSISDLRCAGSRGQKGEEISNLVRMLLQSQIDFDFVHEEMLERAKIAGKKIKIGRQRYGAIILPPVDVIDDRAAQKICDFIRKGGRVFCFGRGPGFTAGGKEVELKNLIRLGESDLLSAMPEKFRACTPNFPEDVARYIIVNKRQSGKKNLYLIFYFGDRETTGSIFIRDRGLPALIDLETGLESRVFHQNSKKGIKIPVTLYPGMSLAIKMGGRARGKVELLDRRWKKIARLSGKWKFVLSGRNVAFPENWQIFETDKWIQARPERLYLDYPASGGRRIRAQFNLGFLPKKLGVAYESGIISEIHINGKPLTAPEHKSDCFDESTREKDITSCVSEGTNTVEAVMKIQDYERRVDYYGTPTLPPIFLLGEFSVKDGAIIELPASLDLGSWTEQGFSNYSGSIVYRKKFIYPTGSAGSRAPLKKTSPTLFLRADVYSGTMAVRLNSKYVGIRAWGPYLIEISPFLKKGENLLEIEVTNSLSNFIEKSLPSGLKYAEIGYLL